MTHAHEAFVHARIRGCHAPCHTVPSSGPLGEASLVRYEGTTAQSKNSYIHTVQRRFLKIVIWDELVVRRTSSSNRSDKPAEGPASAWEKFIELALCYKSGYIGDPPTAERSIGLDHVDKCSPFSQKMNRQAMSWKINVLSIWCAPTSTNKP